MKVKRRRNKAFITYRCGNCNKMIDTERTSDGLTMCSSCFKNNWIKIKAREI